MHTTLRLRVALATSLLAASGIAPVTVAAATPTTTVFTTNPADPEAGEQVCMLVSTTVTAGGGWVNGGVVSVYETTSGSDVYVGGYGYQFGWPSNGGFCISAGLSVGVHAYRADYTIGNGNYDPSSDTVNLDVPKATPQWSLWTGPTSPEAGSPVEITAVFADNGWDEQGTIAVYRNGLASPICTAGPTNEDAVVCTVTAWAAGTYTLTATNSGSASVAPSTSDPLTVVVVANQVHANGVGTQYTTFYPINDNYKDTVAIKGVREEPAGVTIKIYTPGGTLIKTQTIASGSGAYSYAWNGRTSTGTVRAEGKYKITQALKDSAGTTKTYTHYVTLSKKKIYTYTKTISKKGSTVMAKGTNGTGTATLNTTAGTALLKAGSSGWAGVGYDYTLPSATIYSAVKFRIYAKAAFSGPQSRAGMQNFVTCAYSSSTAWNEGCFDKWKYLGTSPTYTTAWYTSTGSATTNRSGTHARGMVSVPAGTVTVYNTQLVVTYGVLKY